MTTTIPSDRIDSTFQHTTNLASSALNSTILSCSNDYFASATNLLTPTPPINRPGVFVHTGAWYDGWETRRHNPSPYDWAVIKLGVASAIIKGIEVDTGFFVGNYGEKAEVQALNASAAGVVSDEEIARADFPRWETILPAKECGPAQRRAWWVDASHNTIPYTHIRLLMYPDGGFGRLRLYGHAIPPPPPPPAAPSSTSTALEELSSALVGGLAISASDQHFTPCSNLLLPGRGQNMGDGWETARSRARGHVDWAIIKLGLRGSVSRVVVDTKDFRGNFPRAVRVHGLLAGGSQLQDDQGPLPGHDDPDWVELVRGEKACQADIEHVYEGDELAVGHEEKVFDYVKLTLVPDGGVKRLRVLGRRA